MCTNGCPLLLEGSNAQTAILCYQYHERLIEPLRAIAREHGYAIGVHGSLKRDIDYIAVAWIENADSPELLADAIGAYLAEHAFQPHFELVGENTPKPRGRVCWSWILEDRCYIDLSIMPGVR
jgi:hypothetical protein